MKLKTINEDYEEDQMLDGALKKYDMARDRELKDEDKEEVDLELDDKNSD